MFKPVNYLICFLLLIASARTDPEPKRLSEVQGLKPVYLEEDIDLITLAEARELDDPGKIYVYENYLLVSERLKGIHIIENSDPTNPVNKAFISIPGNVDTVLTARRRIKVGSLASHIMTTALGSTTRQSPSSYL